MWKFDDSMTCPQCLHPHALVGPRIDPEMHYVCADCGFTYLPESTVKCSGCTQPLTKRCGLHCHQWQRDLYTPPPWASEQEVAAYRDWCIRQ